MSDPSHQSPALSSPRVSSGSRPHFPWSTYTHRTSSSSSSLPLSGSPSLAPQGINWDPSSSSSSAPSASWSSSSARHTANSSSNLTASHNAIPEDMTRHWTFHAFEWVVRDVHKLRDFVEGQAQPLDTTVESAGRGGYDHGNFDILKESPLLADGKFKLEIARVTTGQSKNETQSLSLYITSLMLDYAHSDYEISASMMAAIKSQDDRVGERGARSEWVWDYWQGDWSFRQENEVWECALPTLSSLLEKNPRISETDSFVICVQIHSPIGPFFPQQPFAYYVPRDLLDGLEASLDNPHTGDVKFVCLERLQQSPSSPTPSVSSPPSHHSSVSSSFLLSGSQTTARKRIIYAHSDILVRRSEYFATMLASSFAENASPSGVGERKIYTVTVEEADFVTVYWLLKWVYADWLLFQEEDDPRAAVDGMGAGWSAKWLSGRGDKSEWDWKNIGKAGILEDSVAVGKEDARSATSADSAASSGRGRGVGKNKPSLEVDVTPHATSSMPPSLLPNSGLPSKAASHSPPTSRQPQVTSTPSRRSVSGPISGKAAVMSPTTPASVTSSATRARPAQVPVPLAVPSSGYGSNARYTLSPHQQRPHLHAPATPDPHIHPTTPPPPASALSTYRIAHRYAMPGLVALALEHMMSSITPRTCFPLLLASAFWDELHTLVEDYVVDKFDEVCLREEFDKCCQEVAAGEWGPEGGKTLAALFRRLRSPHTIPYGRP